MNLIQVMNGIGFNIEKIKDLIELVNTFESKGDVTNNDNNNHNKVIEDTNK